jgi:hypothetical protein
MRVIFVPCNYARRIYILILIRSKENSSPTNIFVEHIFSGTKCIILTDYKENSFPTSIILTDYKENSSFTGCLFG